MNRIALARTFALVVATVAALGGCVRPYVRTIRDPALAGNEPCRPSEPCAERSDSDDFLWATDAMETAR